MFKIKKSSCQKSMTFTQRYYFSFERDNQKFKTQQIFTRGHQLMMGETTNQLYPPSYDRKSGFRSESIHWVLDPRELSDLRLPPQSP